MRRHAAKDGREGWAGAKGTDRDWRVRGEYGWKIWHVRRVE